MSGSVEIPMAGVLCGTEEGGVDLWPELRCPCSLMAPVSTVLENDFLKALKH